MGSNENYTTNSQFKNPNMQYIDRILLLEKKSTKILFNKQNIQIPSD